MIAQISIYVFGLILTGWTFRLDVRQSHLLDRADEMCAALEVLVWRQQLGPASGLLGWTQEPAPVPVPRVVEPVTQPIEMPATTVPMRKLTDDFLAEVEHQYDWQAADFVEKEMERLMAKVQGAGK
ncbi:MAG: hypothetical protein JWO67_4553 [Streptosporangiaceae bacterium]|nr:hypothetical protein [Streptosporangiaceae bacterium]